MTGYVGPIEKQTTENTYFRQVLFTAPHSQLVVMCLRPGEDSQENVPFAVGTIIADRPPHRSVRAELPHTAPTLDG